jgi:hypothetical protein
MPRSYSAYNSQTEYLYGFKLTSKFEIVDGVLTLVDNTWAVVKESSLNPGDGKTKKGSSSNMLPFFVVESFP